VLRCSLAVLTWLASLTCAACATAQAPVKTLQVDVCVYGATSAGVAAAVQAARQGNSVVLLDCDGCVGGLSASGLGATDVGADTAIGGVSREFYRRIRKHYDDDASWTAETRAKFRGPGHQKGSDVAFTFEPHVASAVFAAMLQEAKVAVRKERLDREATGIEKTGARIQWIRTEGGDRIAARVFVDCSYEGDLMALAGCSYTVGRESNAQYGETLNGVQVALSTHHQFAAPVDARLDPQDPNSALLPDVLPQPPGPDGSADQGVQAYCFRVCATDIAANQLPWPKPAHYDPRDYELLVRSLQHPAAFAPWHPVFMPNRKTDANNNGAVSFDWIGHSVGWPEGSYAQRERLHDEHRRWQQGLLWTLANDPRVPAKIRKEFERFGLCRDEFQATGGWPPLLYVREARRLIGEYVVTEHDCRGQRSAEDPVGLGAYAMDSHNIQRYRAADGTVRNEGDVQVRVPKPYGISYRAICPKRAQCDNLLVPVCASASHIAYGSIRMEPVFMVLGQSAAIAAGLAIQRDVSVQQIGYPELKEKLAAAGQVVGR
jgi:hypothetical protein